MTEYFDICGTHIPISTIKDFRIIEVEFIFRPVFREIQKSVGYSFSGFNIFSTTNSDPIKKYEFVSMQPYAAIIGQQGHKSALGEYKAKDFKEALGKDITGAVIYTFADKFKLKAFKQQKYQCLNLAGRAFTTFLDDVPVMMTWNDGRIAEVYKEDPLYTSLGESSTPGIQYVSALVIKANETFCFYGNGIQIDSTISEYERLRQEMDRFHESKKRLKLSNKENLTLPQLPKLQFPRKSTVSDKDIVSTSSVEESD